MGHTSELMAAVSFALPGWYCLMMSVNAPLIIMRTVVCVRDAAGKPTGPSAEGTFIDAILLYVISLPKIYTYT